MSQETSEWLNRNTLIGLTDKRGEAWHYRASDQGDEPNHYPGFIPADDVVRRLFNWKAVETPLFIPKADGQTSIGLSHEPLYIKVVDRKAIIHSVTGDVLGIFKDGYVPHDYEEWLLRLVEEILGSDLGISSAGLLQKGGVAWVEVTIPDTITTPEGVTFVPNFLAGTSFNGSLATTYAVTAGLTVCDNTMTNSLGIARDTVKIRHSKYSGIRISDARDALKLVTTQADDFAAMVKELCDIKVSDKEFSLLLDMVAPVSEESGRGATMAMNKRDVLEKLYKNDSRVNTWTGTAFGVLQMDNTYRHHYSIVRGADGGKAERNAQNALMGGTADSDAAILKALAKVQGRELVAA